MNCVAVSGRLGADPELKAAQSGTYWMSFSLAVNAGKDKTVWLDCKAFGKTAELIANHFKKGEGIELAGEFDVEEWEDKNGGGQRKRNVVTVRAISFFGSPASHRRSTSLTSSIVTSRNAIWAPVPAGIGWSGRPSRVTQVQGGQCS